MLIVAVVDEVDVFANVFWLVMVAVKPVTLLQPDPTELFVPATKLTAAHYDEYKSAQTLQPGEEIHWLCTWYNSPSAASCRICNRPR
jgi:hypothetical protein